MPGRFSGNVSATFLSDIYERNEMKAIVEYQGKVYEGEEKNYTEDISAVADDIFKNFDSMTKFKLSLAGGGVLILGKTAIQSAAIIILP